MEHSAKSPEQIVTLQRRLPFDGIDAERLRARDRSDGLPPDCQGMGIEKRREDARGRAPDEQGVLEERRAWRLGVGRHIREKG